MPKILRWRFFQVLAEGERAIGIPMMDLDESELNILWKLGKEGPKSAYKLSRCKYDLPKHVSAPDLTWCPDSEAWKRKSDRSLTYHYPFILKIVKRLEKKGLVRTRKDTSGPRTQKIVELTFPGLMLYLQNSDEKPRLEYAFRYCRDLIPFSTLWESMTRGLGEEKCIMALEKTVREFVDIRRAKFRIRPMRLKFEGFLESPRILMRRAPEVDVIREMDTEVARYLKSEEALLLKNSHIAYFIVHDIRTLSGESRESIGKMIPKLKSEKELAYLEGRNVETDSLFRGDRLREYIPKYASVEYFFTGMFVENLLWNEKIVEKAKEETETPDFEVEFY
jgi:DNA-binding MarR family transcriptional regulator